MTNKELLELAAKAAEVEYSVFGGYITDGGFPRNWNPLTDDGDALRLAVKLSLEIECNQPSNQTAVRKSRGNTYIWCDHNDDPYAATRRAIVRAAAEIGKGMK